MNDSYKEILVKRQTPVGMRVLKGALIGLTVLSLVAGLLMWPLLIVGAILIAVDYFVVPKFDVEYEYLYVNGELEKNGYLRYGRAGDPGTVRFSCNRFLQKQAGCEDQ